MAKSGGDTERVVGSREKKVIRSQMKVVVGGEVIVQMICARLIQYCGTETIPINTAALRLLPLSEVPASPATRIERVLFVILLAFVLIGIELLTVLTHLLFLIVIFLFLAVRAIVNEQCLHASAALPPPSRRLPSPPPPPPPPLRWCAPRGCHSAQPATTSHSNRRHLRWGTRGPPQSSGLVPLCM